MQSSAVPTKIQVPFANAGAKNTIPVASQVATDPALASFTDGFPPATRTALAAGGKPPYGQDFNGVFNAITTIQQFQSAGGVFGYDSTFATAIGGYPKGSVLMSSDFTQKFISTQESNTNDPNAASPVGWISLTAGRLLNVQVFSTPGIGSYTPSPGTKSIIVEVQGGGGGSGGTNSTTTGQVSFSGGGGGGAYAKSRYTSGITSQSLTVGAGGVAGAAGGTGGTGGASNFGSLITAPGGNGSGASPSTSGTSISSGAAGAAIATGGNVVNSPGSYGTYGLAINGIAVSGTGGPSVFGGGGTPVVGTSIGTPAQSKGSGAGGSFSAPSTGALVGAAGAPGIIIVWEFA